VVVLSVDEAVHALEVAVITLTSFNAIAAAIVLVLVFLDNKSQRTKGRSLARELRLPCYLAVAIVISQILYLVREAMEFGAVNSKKAPSCRAINESSWWGKTRSQNPIDP
jgi:hypothetical protein